MIAKLPIYQPSHENMTYLLADLPRNPIQRRVRFSAQSLLTVTEPVTEEERTTLWYSQQERNHQKRLFKYDMRRLAKKLSTTPMPLIHREEIYDFVGMEVSFISSPLAL